MREHDISPTIRNITEILLFSFSLHLDLTLCISFSALFYFSPMIDCRFPVASWFENVIFHVRSQHKFNKRKLSSANSLFSCPGLLCDPVFLFFSIVFTNLLLSLKALTISSMLRPGHLGESGL